ncbi:MAG TPA: ribosome biogenesis factor YjgA [Ottowia sp.]|uniref:ribosome biogenesis factor YjgA n=1 Tax=Ottowia sp. TaxID=1898956 RepID=UPI002C6326E5|nr:ribosome biogenesis factor YjgA [Ottowia sp.]HMN20425.1 ribosome biogenesis factor YjgA [Ottowia sp.]
MTRKPRKGYFVRGQFVATGSELDAELQREQRADGPSKTELKAQSSELQALGEQLLELRADLLAPLALPERLLESLEELRRIRDFEGRRRQGQYVGKLMRRLPGESVAAIRAALEQQQRGAARDTLRLHAAERWRERLLADDATLGAWMMQFPDTDAQQLRTLLRQARKEAPSLQAGEPARASGQGVRQGRAFRSLFQFIQSALERAERADTLPGSDAAYVDDSRAG